MLGLYREGGENQGSLDDVGLALRLNRDPGGAVSPQKPFRASLCSS